MFKIIQQIKIKKYFNIFNTKIWITEGLGVQYFWTPSPVNTSLLHIHVCYLLYNKNFDKLKLLPNYLSIYIVLFVEKKYIT